MINVCEVKTKKEIKDFLNLPLKMYKNNPNFIPPLYGDEVKMFKSNYMYYDQCESKFWLAYKDGVCVGRIQAILQKAANEKWNQKRVRFCRVDFIDDEEVSKALFEKVEEYAKEKGMEEIAGPLGFSDLEREGLLIEGFDELNTFEEQYNAEYYQHHIEKLGYIKEVDWIEHRLTINNQKADVLMKTAEMILKKGQVKLAKAKNLNQFLKKYEGQFFELLDKSYSNIYGTVPFTKGMKELLINNFKPIMNMNYIPIVLDQNDNILGFAIAFPAMNEVLKKSNGHLYPWTIIKLLKSVKHPKVIDLGLVGVNDSAMLSGAIIVIYAEFLKHMIKDKVQYAETNLNLEDNKDILSTWKYFNSRQHKRRRAYIKKI